MIPGGYSPLSRGGLYIEIIKFVVFRQGVGDVNIKLLNKKDEGHFFKSFIFFACIILLNFMLFNYFKHGTYKNECIFIIILCT